MANLNRVCPSRVARTCKLPGRHGRQIVTGLKDADYPVIKFAPCDSYTLIIGHFAALMAH
ncbi:hypothetical protein C9I49_16110 [Pseudomonas prosekii]|uniref:Uncharacterized protein n=1 Tax=Pseudomonas prosekii TaxID=1148509 RepID=A0A2U2D6L2_9PSED|nr:hypothetical protein C9I49_16110 [Pseudomonas prosekii]